MKTKAIPAKEQQRELFSTLVKKHLKQLYNFVRREIIYHVSIGDLLPNEVMVEDVVDNALLRAYEKFVNGPPKREIRSWLIRLASEQLEAAIKQSKAARAREVHIEEDIPETPPTEKVTTLGDEILNFYQPDEDQKLEDIVPDMKVPTPEQIAESHELRRYINRILAILPRIWRRAFVLHYVEDVPVSEIARMTKQPESEVARHLEYAREYLRQRLMEAGFDVSRHDEADLTVFGTAYDVEVPAVYHNAVTEKYKTLEEADNV